MSDTVVLSIKDSDPHVPENVSLVLVTLYRGLNDAIEDERRAQRLHDIAPQLIGTGSPEQEHGRSLRILDWLIRRWLPAWLRLVPTLLPYAEQIQALPKLTNETDTQILPVIRAVWDAATDAANVAANVVNDTVMGVAWGAAWDAATDAAMGTAMGTAWYAAGDTASATVLGTAIGTARAAAWNAAWDAARDAASATTSNAAWNAAWDAARTAAMDALRPIVDHLQEEAITLLLEMCKGVSEAPLGAVPPTTAPKGQGSVPAAEQYENAAERCGSESVGPQPEPERLAYILGAMLPDGEAYAKLRAWMHTAEARNRFPTEAARDAYLDGWRERRPSTPAAAAPLGAGPAATIEHAVALASAALTFGQVRRTTLHPDGSEESDATHTVMLAMVVADLAWAEGLDVGLAVQFAVAHDLPEIYAGDTCTARGLSTEAASVKADREAAALDRLMTELGPCWSTSMMQRYEAQQEPEARLVRYADKIMPKLTHILNGGDALASIGMTVDEVKAKHAAQGPKLRALYPEFEATHTLFDDGASLVLSMMQARKSASPPHGGLQPNYRKAWHGTGETESLVHRDHAVDDKVEWMQRGTIKHLWPNNLCASGLPAPSASVETEGGSRVFLPVAILTRTQTPSSK